MKIKIILTDSDKEYARHHGLTDEEMRGFIEDMIEEQELEELFRHQIKQERKELMSTPQCSVYDAW